MNLLLWSGSSVYILSLRVSVSDNLAASLGGIPSAPCRLAGSWCVVVGLLSFIFWADVSMISPCGESSFWISAFSRFFYIGAGSFCQQ